jgi:hypothetical protein
MIVKFLICIFVSCLNPKFSLRYVNQIEFILYYIGSSPSKMHNFCYKYMYFLIVHSASTQTQFVQITLQRQTKGLLFLKRKKGAARESESLFSLSLISTLLRAFRSRRFCTFSHQINSNKFAREVLLPSPF